MKKLFVSLFIANLLLTVISLIVLPDRVAIHFGADGIPDGWATKYINAAIMLVVHVLVFLSLFFVPEMVKRIDAKWISLPNKAYWLLPENRERMEQLFCKSFYQFGSAMFLLLLWVGILAIQANLASPIIFSENLFLIPFGLFMLYTIIWTVWVIFIFKRPSAKTEVDLEDC